MMRGLALAGAAALFGVAAATAPGRPVLAGGVVALALAVAGIVTLRRWLATPAACLFLADYALALWLADKVLDATTATVGGVAIVLLLQPLEIARCRRDAQDVGVARSQLAGWVVFGVVCPSLVVLALGVAQIIAGSVPVPAAPLFAAAGAIGVIVGLTAALTRPSR